MKIHKLQIVGFGPFKDKQEIDFDALTVDGIFMLEGPTGAGKSSIIDAIVWVLYGTTAHESAHSIKQSVSGRVRSDYVGTDEETRVIMEFSSQGNRYRIQRTPSYMVTKSRGEGERKIEASARLEFVKPVAESLTRIDEIGTRVRDILGMGREQFSQLVVLPQGDFAAFLHASSDERRLILQSIFKTYFYEQVEQFLDEKRKSHIEKLKLLNGEISRHSQNLEQESADGSVRNFSIVKSVLLDSNETDETKYDLLKEVINELSPSTKKETLEQNRIEKELKPITDQITRLLDSQVKIETKAKKQKELESLLKQQIEINQLSVKLKLREKVLPTKADLDGRESAENLLQNAERKILDEYEDFSAVEIAKEISKEKRRHKSLVQKTAQNANLGTLINAARDKLEAIEEQELARKNLKTAVSEIPRSEKQIEKLRLSINELKLIEKNEYAHIVAKKLKPGSACPVCGSKVHPKPLKIKGSFSSAKLKGLEEELEDWREHLSTMRSLKSESEKMLNKRLPSKASVTAEIKSLERKGSGSENDEWELEQTEELLKNLEEAHPFYVERERAQRDYDKFTSRIDVILDKYEFDEDDLEELLNLKTAPIQKKIDEFSASLVSVETYLNLDEIKKLPSPERVEADLNELAEVASRLRDKLKIVNDRLAVAEKTIKNLKIADSGIRDAIKGIELENKSAAPYLDLDSWVSGKNELGLTLTNYVLQERLEMVLERASTHLRKVSHGKYEFRLNEERVGRKRIAGLGIQIMDFRADKVRLAETLSGGETFYASLALALGLAEVVKAEKGGLELGTLFIDEGFGSLSEETLSEVIDVLEGLRSGERIIGIISHVEGMKTQIPLRIEVRASDEGPSTIRFATAEMQ